jgi:hypothetical protein
MAIHGTLGDLGMAEFFQLMGRQKKSGVLIVSSGAVSVKAAFAGGSLIWAETIGPGRQENSLVTLMLGAGVLEKAAASKIGELSKSTLRTPGRIALDEGIVSAADIKRLGALRNNNAISILFSLQTGEYEFIPGEVPVDAELDTPLEPDAVILDAMRTIDEWPAVRSRIRFYNTRWRQNDNAPGFETAADALGFGEGERVVWNRVSENPGWDVRRLIDSCMIGEFETCRALYSLSEGGLITPVYPKSGIPIGSFSGVLGAARGRPWTAIALWAMLVAACAALAFFIFTSAAQSLSSAPAGSSARAVESWAVKESLSGAERRRLQLAIESWRLSKGSYPASLQALVENGRLSKRDLRFPWRLPYVYRVESGGYVLIDPPY